jgi:hypothetical protein
MLAVCGTDMLQTLETRIHFTILTCPGCSSSTIPLTQHPHHFAPPPLWVAFMQQPQQQ